MIDADSRPRAARGFGGTEKEASIAVFRKLKERGRPDGEASGRLRRKCSEKFLNIQGAAGPEISADC